MTTPPSTFDEAYRTGEPPWVIGEPQPAVVALERAGNVVGPVLDLGCGAGEHTILLARLGYEVLGADASPTAVEQARDRARRAGVDATFAVADAFDPAALGRWTTVLDSALFHVFGPEDQARYAAGLAGVVEPGGRVIVLALSTRGPGFGPEIDDEAVPRAFAGPDWEVESLEPSTYRGRVTHEAQVGPTGTPLGGLVDLPALLARVRRTG